MRVKNRRLRLGTKPQIWPQQCAPAATRSVWVSRMEVHASGQTSTNPNPTNLENVGLSRATSPKRQKKNSNLDVPRCRTNASLLTGKLQPERVGLRLRDSTLRRERRDEAAGTLSRVLGARTGASESGSLSCQKRGRAVARDKGGEWAAADASRDLLDGSGCTCERE